MRKIDLIIVHCSATPEGKDFTTADIDRWHRQRGFASIGYHFVIYRDALCIMQTARTSGSALPRAQRPFHRHLLYRWFDRRRQTPEGLSHGRAEVRIGGTSS